MRLAFSTLGCPAWTLDDVCRHGRAMGFDGVDFRGLGAVLDVTSLSEFTGDVAATRRRLDDSGLAVTGLSSSIRLCDAGSRHDAVEEARRCIEVASALGAGVVRVFGGPGGPVPPADRRAAVAAAVETLDGILQLPGATGVVWAVETHDHWASGGLLRPMLEAAGRREVGAVWDMGHTLRVGGETAEQTLGVLHRFIRYVHFKDAVYRPGEPGSMADGWRYVLPGEGELPLASAFHRLREAGYNGDVVFEHEKRWHPGLPEPEVAFPACVAWFRGVMDSEVPMPPG